MIGDPVCFIKEEQRMTWGTSGRYRVIRIKRGDPHTVYLGAESASPEEWSLSATVPTRNEALTRGLEQCRRERGTLQIGQTNDDLPNNVKLDRITEALRAWQQVHGRGNRGTRA